MTDLRNELEFRAIYSFHVETLTECFNRRVDRLLTLLLILLGSSIAASFDGQVLWGALVAIISATQFVYRFGEHAAIADDRAKEYQRLVRDMKTTDMQDDELRHRNEAISGHDSKPPTFIKQIAYRNALIQRDQIEDHPEFKFGWWTSVMSFLFGGTPIPKKPRQGHGGEAQAAHDETPA